MSFDWPRYHAAIVAVIESSLGFEPEGASPRPAGMSERRGLTPCEPTC